MKKSLKLLVAFSPIVPILALAAGPFEEKDFVWEPFKSLYKRVIIVGVNKIARENPECAVLDPKSLEHDGGTPDDPEFIVTCGEAGHTKHFRFSKSEITGDPASNVPLEDRKK